MKKLICFSLAAVFDLAVICFVAWVALGHNSRNEVAWHYGFTQLVGLFGGTASFCAIIIVVFSVSLGMAVAVRQAFINHTDRKRRERVGDSAVILGALVVPVVARHWIDVPSTVVWLAFLAAGLFIAWQAVRWPLLWHAFKS